MWGKGKQGMKQWEGGRKVNISKKGRVIRGNELCDY
jgi:hypothetical protein